MDITDLEILKAIDTVSPKTFISPFKVIEVVGSDATELGNRLKLLKKSGRVEDYHQRMHIRSESP